MEGQGTIELGDEAKDTVTGLTGVVVCRTQWLHGCVRFGVQPRELKDGKPVDPTYVDEPQLELVTKAVARRSSATGGPRPAPVRHADHAR